MPTISSERQGGGSRIRETCLRPRSRKSDIGFPVVKPQGKICIGTATLAALILAVAVHAGTMDEIQHLLDYVGGSSCSFVRNGAESDAAAARKHLATKYAYAQSGVGSAEDFIRLVASRSSMTGEPYIVHCGTSRFLSADWLTDELRRYRGREIRKQ